MNNIMDLTLSKNVTKIPQGCFSMNIFMYEVEIPDTVTEIDDMAFAGARLETLEIPSSVTRIGRKAFHLHHLTSLHIPGNVKVIDESAFEGTFKASTLSKLTIDEGVESIGKYAFKEALLEEVKLPSSLKEMGESPFYSNKGKDGSRVVYLYSDNPDHLKFNNDEYHNVEAGQPAHYHVVKVLLSKAKVGGIKTKTYTGKSLAQSTATVKMDGNTLTKDSDYSVTYKNNKNVGKATVTFCGKGDYAGSVSATFTINPKGTSLSRLKSGAKKGTAVITWKKQSAQTSGYQVMYSLKKNFSSRKIVKIKNVKTVKYTLKKLKSKKTYYVKIRTYKTVGKKTYYSKWSSPRKVRAK